MTVWVIMSQDKYEEKPRIDSIYATNELAQEAIDWLIKRLSIYTDYWLESYEVKTES